MSKDQPSRYGANQIAEIANGIVDPVLLAFIYEFLAQRSYKLSVG